MFLKDLDQTQREVFAALAQRIVLADWELAAGEEAALDAVRAQIGEIKPQAGDIFGNDRIGCFTDDRTKRGVLYELLLLTHADQDLHDSERHALMDLTKEFGIESSVFNRLNELAERHARAIADGVDTNASWEQAKTIVDG